MRNRMTFAILALLAICAAPLAAQTVPAGTEFVVMLDEAISSKNAKVDQKVKGHVSEAVVVNGRTVIPKGSSATLKITTAEESGRLSGTAKLWLVVESVVVNGRTYTVSTDESGEDGSGHKKRNVIAIGGGAAAGAVIGAIAGGGKGAAIGTAIGAGAGTAAAAATGKKDIEYPAETQLAFQLKSPVTIVAASSKGLRKGQKR